MIYIKTEQEIAALRVGGARLARVVQEVATLVKPGVTGEELETKARALISGYGDTPAFLGYRPAGHRTTFPTALCVSVDDEIVHGIPNDNPLREGSIVSIDCGVRHQGLFTDHAVTVPVGAIAPDVQQLITTTKEALDIAIRAAQPGNTIGDIGHAVETFVAGRYGIIRELAGHGVGREIHEDPYVPNFGKPGAGAVLKPGMVIAIEPMLTLGGHEIAGVDSDEYTLVTADGSWSAHFEHTVAITENGPEVLTIE